MPYIKPEDRRKFDEVLNDIDVIGTKGELEYCIFKLMKKYMEDKEARYSTLHDTVYAATHCADEFRRRFLDKREDSARAENGDVEMHSVSTKEIIRGMCSIPGEHMIAPYMEPKDSKHDMR